MLESELLRDVGAHRPSEHVRLEHMEVVHQRQDVIHEILLPDPVPGVPRQSGSPVVEGNHPVFRGQLGYHLFEEGGVSGESVDEYDGVPLPLLVVMHLDSVDVCEWHLFVANLPG